MTCQVILEFRVQEGRAGDLLRWMRDNLPDTRAFSGCVSLDVTRDQDSPNSFLVVEQWMSRPDYAKYFAWRNENGSLANLAALMDGAPSIRYFDYAGV